MAQKVTTEAKGRKKKLNLNLSNTQSLTCLRYRKTQESGIFKKTHTHKKIMEPTRKWKSTESLMQMLKIITQGSNLDVRGQNISLKKKNHKNCRKQSSMMM